MDALPAALGAGVRLGRPAAFLFDEPAVGSGAPVGGIGGGGMFLFRDGAFGTLPIFTQMYYTVHTLHKQLSLCHLYPQ